MIRNLDVVQVRHQEVRVASDPDLGQVYDGDIAAVAVHNMPPPLGNFEENAPLLLAGIHARLVGDVVAVIDDDPYVRALRVCPGLDGQGPPRLLGIRLVPHSSAGAAAAGAELALAGPADVDDAYQVFDNGELAGHFGDFSGRKPEINLTSPECSRWRKRAITAQSPTRTSPHGFLPSGCGSSLTPCSTSSMRVAFTPRRCWARPARMLLRVSRPIPS
jgi:hypothetical protein